MNQWASDAGKTITDTATVFLVGGGLQVQCMQVLTHTKKMVLNL